MRNAEVLLLNTCARNAGLQDRIRLMANVIITLRIMPEDEGSNLGVIEEQVKIKVHNHSGNNSARYEQEPIAFGLKAIKVIFIVDENKNLESLENSIREISNIASVEAVDVRRAIG